MRNCDAHREERERDRERERERESKRGREREGRDKTKKTKNLCSFILAVYKEMSRDECRWGVIQGDWVVRQAALHGL